MKETFIIHEQVILALPINNLFAFSILQASKIMYVFVFS